MERLLDESVRTGIVEYHFSVDGIEIISQLGISKNYWTAYKGYATKGQYIYAVTILRAVLFYIMGSKGGYEMALITKIKAYREQAGIKQFLIFFLF